MKTSRLAFALVPLFVVASLPAQTSWTAGTGNFTDSSNWSAGVPSNNNTFITNGTSVTPSIVNFSDGSAKYVANLTLVANNTLNIDAGSELWASGTISNNGAINLGSGYVIVNAPSLLLTGSGTVTLSAPNSYFEGTSTGQTLTNQSTIVGQGTLGNGFLAVVNSGTINANVSGQTLVLDGQSGSVNTANTGLIEATNGGVLAISGGAVNNAGGNLTASGTGSTLQVSGNTTVIGGNLTASGTGSTLEISGAFVQGGTLTNSGGTMGAQPGYTATLDGSTAAGAITLNGTFTNGANSSTYVNGSIVNHGTIALTSGGGGYGSYLQLQGSTTLSGGGTVTLGSSDGSGTAYIQQVGSSLTLTNADNTIQGYGTIGNGGLTLVNQGTINANSSGNTLLLNGNGGVTNTGTLEATGGGILNIQNMTVGDAGKSIQANGGAVQIQNSTIVGGALTATGGGTFNQGVNDTNVTLDGFTSGAFTLSTGTTWNNGWNSTTYVNGSLINDGTIALTAGNTGYSSYLQLQGSTTLSGGGTLTLGSSDGSGTVYIQQVGSNLTLTNANNTIQGYGVIGNGGLTLANQGTINANSSGNTLLLNGGGGVTNTGTLEATGGGILNIQNTTVNDVGHSIQANGGAVQIQGSTIVGGALTATGGGTFNQGVNNTNVTFDPGSVSGAFTISTGTTWNNGWNSTTYVNGSLINDGTIALTAGNNGYNSYLQLQGSTTLSGGGTVSLGSADGTGTVYIEETGSNLTLTNADNTIQGYGVIGNGGLTLVNQGAINSNSAGKTLLLNGGGGVTNTGTLEATGGGILGIQNTTVNDVGHSIQANGGAVQIQGSTIVGGALTATGGGTFNQGVNNTNVTLDGFTSGALTLSTGTTWNNGWNSTTYVNGSLINHGTIALTSGNSGYNSYLQLEGSTTLSGGGTVTMGSSDGSATVYIEQAGASLTLTNADNTIEGYGVIGNGALTVINGGTLLANSPGNTLLVNGGGGLTNNGTLQANAGSALQVTSNLANFSGNTLSGGTYVVNGASGNTGTIQLSSLGTSPAGEIVNSSAKITLNGPTANTLFVDAGGNNALTPIAQNMSGGSLTLEGGYTLTTSGNLSNAGAVVVGGSDGSNGTLAVGGSTYTQAGGTTQINSGGTLNVGPFYTGTLHVAGGTVALAGGTINANQLTVDSPGTINGFGTIAFVAGDGASNQGLIEANGGTLSLDSNVLGTTGTLQVNPGATLKLANGAGSGLTSTTGTLTQNGTLALGANNLTVSTIYTNANFGTGNSFNAQADVTGTGVVNAVAGTAQSITGTAVTGGTTTTPTLTLSNIRLGGSESTAYNVVNSGTGASLTGALQTSVNGGNITNGNLSGSGVTAGSYGSPTQLAPTQSQSFTVTLTGTTTGPLTGQDVNIESDFANVAAQKLAITGGAVYQPAEANTLTGTVNLGNFHVNAPNVSTGLTVTNIAPNTNGYTETLGVAVTGSTGGVTPNGSVAGTLTYGQSSSAISAALNTSSAGPVSGTVTLGFTSTPLAGEGLSTLALAPQTVTVQGTGYNLATASLGTINIGSVYVNSTQTASLSVQNTGTGIYTEGLDASAGPVNTTLNGGAATLLTSTNSLSNIAAGTSQNLQFNVNTSAAGTIGGTVLVDLFSDGSTTSGLGTTALTPQSAGVTGTINVVGVAGYEAVASAATPNPVNFGSVRINATSPTQALSISNTQTNLPSDGLNASISTASPGVTAGGLFTSLAAGSTNNTSLVVGMSTATAGAVSGAATIALASDGTYNNGNGPVSLGTQTIGVTGAVYQPAIASILPTSSSISPINLGNVRVNGTLSQTLTISNSAPNTTGYTETLSGSVGGMSGSATANGSFSGVTYGTSSTGISVGLATGTAGAVSGTATLGFVSNPLAGEGLSPLTLASQNVYLTGGVYQEAIASTLPTTINLGTMRTGTVVNSTTSPVLGQSAALGLSIKNVAPTSGGYTENLGASFGALSSGLSGSGSPITGLAVGNTSNAMALSFTAGAAGSYNGSAVVNFETEEINGSGLGNAGIGSQTVDVDAIVNALADGVVQQNGGTYSFSGGANSGTLNFGAITQGSGTVGDALELLNDVTGDADMLTGGYSPALIGPFSYTPGNGATFSLGDMGASDFDVSFDTDYSPTGFFSETLVLSENSYNAAQGAMALTPYDLTIEGTINPAGPPGVPDSSATLLLFGLGLASLVLVRRWVL